jgi:hypothetical protein
MYPTKKQSDCEMLAAMMTDKDFKELATLRGMEDSEISKVLK